MAPYNDPYQFIQDYYDKMFAPSTPSKQWWEGPQTAGGATSQPQPQPKQQSFDPYSFGDSMLGGFNMGTGNAANIGSQIAGAYSAPGFGVPGNWDMMGALGAGAKGAAGGMFGGLAGGAPGMAMGGLMGGLGSLGSNLAGQIGSNVPGWLGLEAAPNTTNALNGVFGMSPSQASFATNAIGALASLGLGPLGMGAVSLADLIGNALQGKNISNQVASLALSPLGMLGPIGSVIGQLVGPTLGAGINYGYQGMTTGIDPTATHNWNAQEISQMTPGALATTSYGPGDIADALEGIEMQQRMGTGYTGDLYAYDADLGKSMVSNYNNSPANYASALAAAGWDKSWADFMGNYAQEFNAQMEADDDGGDGSGSGSGGESGASGGADTQGGTD